MAAAVVAHGVVVGGLDVDNGLDQSVTPSNIVTDINSTMAQGSVTEYRRQIPTYSASGTLTAKPNLSSTLSSSTSLGMQYINEQNHYRVGVRAQPRAGHGLAGRRDRRCDRQRQQSDGHHVGTYGREQLAWRDRLFLTGGLRADRNSAFGTNVEFAYYPSASLSWVASEEDFMRDRIPSWVDQMRLRGAYGQSGQRPAFRQAETYLNSAAVSQGATELPAVVIGGTGNAEPATRDLDRRRGRHRRELLRQQVGVAVHVLPQDDPRRADRRDARAVTRREQHRSS